MALWFYDDQSQRSYAGGVILSLSSPPHYMLSWCNTSQTNFPAPLPSETDKVWTITLTRSSGTPRVVIHCNNKEVLNVVLSDSTCSCSDWSDFWSRDVKRILFIVSDEASDFYRSGEKLFIVAVCIRKC